MKLAEALAKRADVQTRMVKLQPRTSNMMQVQEGEKPEEDPKELLAEYDRLLAEMTTLVMRINRTNVATKFDDEHTIADAIALRDAAKKEHNFYQQMADAASARQNRYSASEIKYVPTYSVTKLRKKADEAAKRYRELDTKIQGLNWNTDLLD
ncbi:hypothetical protein BK816_08085 [Boudabousia tangfeifanii]|uniref:DIP1984 family protein n=1 Tax=Boudabousia tangfeifanii TaxID=1912795 RepID=A0A1D9MLR6_9ACTO|nr:DIP1984 family protein [Boudabousia tangfeifanii]AOZ73247.1 hypothetical protein BK816_08085 [Boudabousia tangfeifanii]